MCDTTPFKQIREAFKDTRHAVTPGHLSDNGTVETRTHSSATIGTDRTYYFSINLLFTQTPEALQLLDGQHREPSPHRGESVSQT